MVDNYQAIKQQMFIESTFGTCTVSPVCAIAPCPPCGMNKEKGNNPMDDKVYYLKGRIDEISYDFKEGLIKQFAVKAPNTFADLVTAIKNGTYTAPTTDDNKRYNLFDGVKWGDQAGYEAAIKAMKSAKQIALDTITVKDPATDGLAAMQAFEAWTYTAPAVPTTPVTAG